MATSDFLKAALEKKNVNKTEEQRLIDERDVLLGLEFNSDHYKEGTPFLYEDIKLIKEFVIDFQPVLYDEVIIKIKHCIYR